MAAEALPPAPLPGMTEEEFDDWCNEETRAEFIDGRVEMLCPVSLLHDTADGLVYCVLSVYLELRGTGGRILRQPFQVRLRPGLRREPDITCVASENLDRLRHTREVISGFWVRTAWLWQEPIPRTLDCLREMGVFPG